MDNPRISLEQWRCLLAVVDAGGYAQAAAALHKSQSAVSYGVQKIESQLGVKAFEIQGRKAKLTSNGQVLYRRARALLEEASALEGAAGTLAAGWEPEIRLAVDVIFPTWLLLECFAKFGAEQPQVRIELYETVLGGTEEALTQRRVDFAIGATVPAGFSGDPLIRLRFVGMAHPDHPLHRLGRELTVQDLRKHRHVVIRDTGSQRRSGSRLGAEQSWTVSQKATSIHAVSTGQGYAWFPEDTVRGEVARGELKQLPMREGGEAWGELYLVFADRDYAGRGALRLAQIIRERTAAECSRSAPSAPGTAPTRRTRRR